MREKGVRVACMTLKWFRCVECLRESGLLQMVELSQKRHAIRGKSGAFGNIRVEICCEWGVRWCKRKRCDREYLFTQ